MTINWKLSRLKVINEKKAPNARWKHCRHSKQIPNIREQPCFCFPELAGWLVASIAGKRSHARSRKSAVGSVSLNGSFEGRASKQAITPFITAAAEWAINPGVVFGKLT